VKEISTGKHIMHDIYRVSFLLEVLAFIHFHQSYHGSAFLLSVSALVLLQFPFSFSHLLLRLSCSLSAFPAFCLPTIYDPPDLPLNVLHSLKHRITGVSDFIHHPDLIITRKTGNNVSETGSVSVLR
jgi:hypothetical protein